MIPDRPHAPATPAAPALSVLVAVDPVLRDAAAASLTLGAPDVVVVRHDLLPDDGALRRVVVDATGVLEDETVALEHACVSCSVREDAVPALARLADDGRWAHLVLALPVTAEPLPVARSLAAQAEPGGVLETLRLAATVGVVDLDALESDLLGDDLVDERGLALTDDDQRPVGEALAAQLEQVDVVVTTGASATGGGLVDRLWQESLPGDPRAALQNLVSRLRAVAGRGVVRATETGYALGVVSDLDRVRDGLTRARREVVSGDPAAAQATAEDALRLWAGTPGGDLEGGEFADVARELATVAQRWRDELRLVRRDAAEAAGR
ncbi:GTP-binding protein, partial [Isoptericola sp. QY 916]|uniref:GTP-binding protein n=1 Tax=Isoptericola sp. QY 916 TaxID=2782570 RepID=UPI003D2FE44C